MKRNRVIAMAKEIGDMHYELINFDQLPRNASKKRQVEALLKDQQWQEDHQADMNAHIGRLIDTIEGYQ